MKYAIPILLATCSPAMGSDLTPEHLRQIQEFEYGGIGFSTSLTAAGDNYVAAFFDGRYNGQAVQIYLRTAAATTARSVKPT